MFITRSWILLTYYILFAFGTTRTQIPPKPCKINNETEGVCILIRLCPQALELLRVNIQSLRNITCGYDKLDAKVCCANNRTDDLITFKSTTQVATSRPDTTASTVMSRPTERTPITTTTVIPTTSSTTVLFFLTTPSSTNAHRHSNEDIAGESNVPATPTVNRYPVNIPPGQSQVINGRPGHNITIWVLPIRPTESVVADDQSNIFPSLTEDTTVPHKVTPAPLPNRFNYLPNRQTCGIVTTSDRIYGGEIASVEEFPWLVRIKYLINSKERYSCAGSLITDRYVITAAHCVVNLTIIDVRLGEWDIESPVDCFDGICSDPVVDVKVDMAIPHPSYNRRTLVGDIALLRLAHPVNFTDFIRPICLPTTDLVARQDYNSDESYETAGWGSTEYEKVSIVKRKLIINAVPMQTCRIVHSRLITDELAANAICAGGRLGQDTCVGDSGGSLAKQIFEDYSKNWFILGVTSFGTRQCGREGVPGVYTRITSYMDWITSTVSS